MNEQVTLPDLCAVAKASPRTLQRSFKSRLGRTPKAYIQARRLNYARKELSNVNNEKIKVADIANRWGFWHMGQFASDYRNIFGELPSETLNREK